MSGKESDIPVTPAIRTLRASGQAFELLPYTYVEHGGTANAARQLGAPDHAVIKTIVLETDTKAPLICLMHGDREVSTKALARLLGAKTVEPAPPPVAERLTGYQVGGTSPFGTRTPIDVVAHASIRELRRLFINGGKRGFLFELTPELLDRLLSPRWAEIAA